MTEQKGGVTIPLFHCIFNGIGSVTHYIHDYDEMLYQTLPNIYAVCISDNRKGKKIAAGFIIKTSYTHEDSEFQNALENYLLSTPRLKKFVKKYYSFMPARLGVDGDAPPSEDEMLSVMIKQFQKHHIAGNA